MDKPLRYTLKKSERLCSKKLLDDLFSKDQQIKIKEYPLLLVAKSVPHQSFTTPAQIVFSISKKRFKKAVDRNSVRRKIREAYRLNKQELYNTLLLENEKLAIAILYLDNKALSFKQTEQKIIVLLKRLKKHIEESA